LDDRIEILSLKKEEIMFKKGMTILICCLFLFGAAAGCANDGTSTEANGENGEKEELSYAMSGLYRPFNYKDGGELTGFDVEIGQEIAKRLDMEANPVTNPFETLVQGLKAEKYDAIIGSMAITDERLEQVDFSRPYYRSGAQVYVAEDNDTIKSEADLKDKTIGVVKASTFRDVALEYTDKANVIGYDSDVVALQDLPTGRVDAVITDRMVGVVAINEENLAIQEVDEPLWIDEMAIAVRKGDSKLLEDINAALEEMIEDGTYEEISMKWFDENILGE